MHTSRAPWRLASCASRQKCRLLAIELLPQIRISFASAKNSTFMPTLPPSVCVSASPPARGADGAIQQRGARAGGRSGRPCPRPAPGPWCRSSCRAGWPAGRARRSRCSRRGDVVQRLVPGHRLEPARALGADAPQRLQQALGVVGALGVARDLGAQHAGRWAGAPGLPCTLIATPSSHRGDAARRCRGSRAGRRRRTCVAPWTAAGDRVAALKGNVLGWHAARESPGSALRVRAAMVSACSCRCGTGELGRRVPARRTRSPRSARRAGAQGDRIVLAQSAPFTGPAAQLGIQFHRAPSSTSTANAAVPLYRQRHVELVAARRRLRARPLRRPTPASCLPHDHAGPVRLRSARPPAWPRCRWPSLPALSLLRPSPAPCALRTSPPRRRARDLEHRRPAVVHQRRPRPTKTPARDRCGPRTRASAKADQAASPPERRRRAPSGLATIDRGRGAQRRRPDRRRAAQGRSPPAPAAPKPAPPVPPAPPPPAAERTPGPRFGPGMSFPRQAGTQGLRIPAGRRGKPWIALRGDASRPRCPSFAD